MVCSNENNGKQTLEVRRRRYSYLIVLFSFNIVGFIKFKYSTKLINSRALLTILATVDEPWLDRHAIHSRSLFPGQSIAILNIARGLFALAKYFVANL